MKTLFNVGGEIVSTVKEVNNILGRKVSKKDLMEGLVPEVTVTIEEDEVANEDTTAPAVLEEAKEEEIATEEIEEEIHIKEVAPVTEDTQDIEGKVAGTSAMLLDEEDIAGVAKHIAEAKARAEARKTVGTSDKTSKVIDLPIVIHKDPNAPKPTLEQLRNQLKTVYDRKVAENPELVKSAGKSSKADKYDDTITEFPEKGTFTVPEDLKKFYKKLPDARLDEWLELEGLTYTPNENPGINRMRKCMAMMDYHFVKEPSTSKKKKSKYGDYTTEDLIGMALDNNLAVKDDKGNERILRMYTIMSLKDAGLLE